MHYRASGRERERAGERSGLFPRVPRGNSICGTLKWNPVPGTSSAPGCMPSVYASDTYRACTYIHDRKVRAIIMSAIVRIDIVLYARAKNKRYRERTRGRREESLHPVTYIGGCTRDILVYHSAEIFASRDVKNLCFA